MPYAVVKFLFIAGRKYDRSYVVLSIEIFHLLLRHFGETAVRNEPHEIFSALDLPLTETVYTGGRLGNSFNSLEHIDINIELYGKTSLSFLSLFL